MIVRSVFVLLIGFCFIAAGETRQVKSGDSWVVSSTTALSELVVESGATVKAADGKSLTLTVDGVEVGQALVTSSGVDSAIVPGKYSGVVVVTVVDANVVAFDDGSGSGSAAGGTPPSAPPDGGGTPPSGTPPSGTPPTGTPPTGTPPTGTPPSGGPPSGTGTTTSSSALSFPLRQALYLDDSGLVSGKSVAAAATYTVGGSVISGLSVNSSGEVFNGLYAAGGSYSLKDAVIRLDGNGRSDFVGYGAAITATGTNTKLVIDGADIQNHGVVRTAVVATGGSNVVVKNSKLSTASGVLPADYTPSVNTKQMRSAPWMLGLNPAASVRATNLLGNNSKAAYINSSITSDGWGVLSTDSGSGCTLTAINSTVTVASDSDGYGSYAIGNATEYFLGTQISVGGYAAINTGGVINYGNSSAAKVSELNSSLSFGLTSDELASLVEQPTVVNSKRFGVMWHSSSGTVNIAGGTQFNTGLTSFLVKSTSAVSINVDGSAGAKLSPGNGVLMQVMDDDDPGPVGTESLNTGVYVETTDTPARVSSFDVTSTANAAAATFSNIVLRGDFYNSVGWTVAAGSSSQQNMALTFNNATITGVISAAEAHHAVGTIDSSLWDQLGVVQNTPRAAINNGVIVTLNAGSKWVVTGTSHLTKLAVATGASVVSPLGGAVTMTVDGVTTQIVPGQTYTGAIRLTM